MRRRITAVLLTITVFAMGLVPTIVTKTQAATSSELLTNDGNFTSYNASGIPNGWTYSGGSVANLTAAIDTTDKSPNGSNSFKFTQTAATSSPAYFYNNTAISLKKDCDYTISMWVKSNNLKGLRFYLYEPVYVPKGGTSTVTSDIPIEGGNIYSYYFNNGSTRVIRDQIYHTFKFDNNTIISDKSSMGVVRTTDAAQTPLDASKDYPGQTQTNTWVKFTHTFSTSGSDGDLASVRYAIGIKNGIANNGTASIANISFMETPKPFQFTPTVNNAALGSVTPTSATLQAGQNMTFTATPTGINFFKEWLLNGQHFSSQQTITSSFSKTDALQAVFGAPDTVTPTVNNGDLGYVLPKTVIWQPGQNSTFAACPIDGNTFTGWTLNGQPYPDVANSKNTIVTAAFAKTDVLTANFEQHSPITNASSESLTVGTNAAPRTLDTTVTPNLVKSWDGDWKLINDGNDNAPTWLTAEVSNTVAHSGSKSIKLMSRYNIAGRKITGLQKNTKYFVSFWYYLPAYTSTNTNSFSWASVVPTTSSKMYTIDANKTSLGNVSPNKNSDGKWTCVTIPFDSKDNTEVYVTMKYNSASASDYMYVDDFGLLNSDGNTETVTVNAATTPGGTGDASKMGIAAKNSDVTYVATPESGFTFLGWFDANKKLVKTDLAFSEKALGNISYTAKYDYVNVVASSSPGGTASVPKSYAPKNASVTFTATPNAGVAFLGWYDQETKTKLMSTEKVYTVTADKDINLYAKFDSVQVGITGVGLGGSATVSKSGALLRNEVVTFTATPLPGNTFNGWYNSKNDVRVSKEASYTITASEDTLLYAKFDGDNKPPVEQLKTGGFESGTVGDVVSGWYISSGATWATFKKSDFHAYQGTKSLQVVTRFSNAILPINSLNKNSNYRISFYYYLHDHMASTTDRSTVSDVFIAPQGVTDAATGSASFISSMRGPTRGGPGWQKVELTFNTGDLNAVNLGIAYIANSGQGLGNECLYIDNLELYEYASQESLKDGNFDNSASWVGSYNTTANKEAELTGAAASIQQTLTVTPFTDYLVTFKAKASATSSVKAAVVDLVSNGITNSSLITSYSYADAAGTNWTNYQFAFNSRDQKAVKLMFQNIGTGTSLVDNVTFVAKEGAAEGKIEVIDFETDRFAINDYSTAANVKNDAQNKANYFEQSSAFERYKKADANDSNVRSGDYSLRIKYNAANNDIDKILQQAWSSFPVKSGGSYRLTVWYKAAKAEGGVTVSPDATGTYGSETSYMVDSTDWTRLRFNISNSKNFSYVRMVLANLANTTASDIYIDDIVFQNAQPMVTEENTRLTYTELLYNTIKNQSFEQATTAADWGAKLPSNFTIVDTKKTKGDAAPTQNKYLHVAQSNGKYTLTIPTKPGVEYGFGAFVRGKAGVDAYIGLTDDAEAKSFFLNADDQPVSKITVTQTDGQWHRSGFKFVAGANGLTTIVIEAKGGSIDIDNVMMFPVSFGYRYDPNDYTIYTPYNFNDMTHNTYINGGEGPQPYAGVDQDGSGNPSNGDRLPVAMMVVMIMAGVSLLAVFATGSKRRKVGAKTHE